MAFTSLAGERAFVERAIACADDADLVACMAEQPSEAWSVGSTEPFDLVAGETVCRWRQLDAAGQAADARVDLVVEHDDLAALSMWITHDGVREDVILPETSGNLVELVDHPVPGFAGSATGRWTLCVHDSDADGDAGRVARWSVHD
jgi:hypothetical protein